MGYYLLVLLNPETDISGFARERVDVRAAYDQDIDYSQMVAGGSVSVERLRPWFSPATFNEVMYLALREAGCPEPGTKAAMRIALSATLKAACAQDRGWGCIADNVRPTQHQLEKVKDALGRFERNIGVLAKDIPEAREALPLSAREFLVSVDLNSYIAQADTREDTNVADESVDLLITSPPYPEMTDYSTSQRLSYYWIGGDPADDLPSEIGARRKRFRTSSISEYRAQMVEAITALCRKLKPGGYAALEAAPIG